MRETASGLVLAPVLLRMGAVVLDVALLSLIGLMLALFEIVDFRGDATEVSAIAQTALVAGYFIAFLALRSATPGKTMMNIYVAYPDGGAIRPDTAILRVLIMVIEYFSLVGLILILILLVVDRERRTFHDRISGTLVLAGRPGAPLRIDDPRLGPSAGRDRLP